MKILPALCLAFALSTAPARSSEPFDMDAARALFESKCSPCHTVDRALRKNKDRPDWEKTVTRMKRYASGAISDQDAATISEFLARERGNSE